jgi:hypothetical protein
MILKLRFELGKPVELWGFEPQTSCMPCDYGTGLGGSGRRRVSHLAAGIRPGGVWTAASVPARWLPELSPDESMISACSISRTSKRRLDAGAQPGGRSRPWSRARGDGLPAETLLPPYLQGGGIQFRVVGALTHRSHPFSAQAPGHAQSCAASLPGHRPHAAPP